VITLIAGVFTMLQVPRILGETVDALSRPDAASEAVRLAALLFALGIGSYVVNGLWRYLLNSTARRAQDDLRRAFFAHLSRQSPDFFAKHSSGDLIARVVRDSDVVHAVWGQAIGTIVGGCSLLIVANVMMFTVSVELSLWTFILYPSVWLLSRMFFARTQQSARAAQQQAGQLAALIQEDFSGIAMVKGFGLEDSRTERIAREADAFARQQIRVEVIVSQMVPLVSTVASVVIAIVLLRSGSAIARGELTVGEVVSFYSYVGLMLRPLMNFGRVFALLARAGAAWKRISGVLAAKPSIVDGPQREAEQLRGEIEVRNLTVTRGDRAVLQGVSLHLTPGSSVALVGRTGSGKSTLMEVLARMIAVPDGTLLFDGHDANQLPLDVVRRSIGYAPQDPFLFSTTIAENLRFGLAECADPTEAGEHAPALERVIDAAGLQRDTAAFPEGLETMVGERGVTVSGGQRQRIALARALIARPRILLLDDSLAAVDTQTEREILDRLRTVMADCTTVLIAHRPATIREADRIVVLDEGRIVEQGRHEELLAQGGVYAQVYKALAATEEDHAA